MAERKSINKYYPPDWDPSKGSINTYRGRHHLGDRAKKLNEGILIVRFEMPFSVWCLGCNNLIGAGVRFNAEKKIVGKYFTTNILNFKMSCHQCNNKFEIETDPKNTEYKIKNGLRKRISEFDSNDAESFQLTSSSNNNEDNEDQDNNKNNNENEEILLKLENKKKDIQRGKESATQLERLEKLMGDRSLNDYKLSSIMRKNFRENKKAEEQELKRQQSKGIIIPLLKEQQDDIDAAKEIDFKFNSLKRKLDETKTLKREIIKNESIIKSSTTNSTSNNNNNNSKLENILKKKSRIDPSLFNKNNNNLQSSSKVNNAFSSNLFNR